MFWRQNLNKNAKIFWETIFEIWKHQCLFFMFSLLRFIWWTFDVIIDVQYNWCQKKGLWLKMWSDKIIYWLGRYFFLLGFIMSRKNMRGCVLNFWLEYRVTNLLVLVFWHNKTQKESVNKLSLFQIRLKYNIFGNLAKLRQADFKLTNINFNSFALIRKSFFKPFEVLSLVTFLIHKPNCIII